MVVPLVLLYFKRPPLLLYSHRGAPSALQTGVNLGGGGEGVLGVELKNRHLIGLVYKRGVVQVVLSQQEGVVS